MNWGTEKITSNSTWYSETKHLNMDLKLNYRLSEIYRVYAAYKFQVIYIGENISGGDQFAVDGTAVLKSPAYVPALGIGYSQILNKNLCLQQISLFCICSAM